MLNGNKFLLLVALTCAFVQLSQGWLFWGKKKEKDTFNVNDVTFYLATRSNRVYQAVKLTSMTGLTAKGFVGSKRTTFITHGWKSHHRKPWVQNMVTSLLNAVDHNVFVVDWSKGADRSDYKAAVKNTRVTGSAMSDFILRLQGSYNMSRSQVHLIGHSLGGHCSAEAGKRIQNPKLARISGLDVPDLGVKVNDPSQTLDPTDADFVDETHTQMSWSSKGHADFFPNGGLQMPGCKKLGDKFVDGIKALLEGNIDEAAAMLRCDHSRSIHYYTESISSTNCHFTARACSSWGDYKDHQCDNGQRNVMGYHAKKPRSGRQKYYLRTNANPPYCKRPLASEE